MQKCATGYERATRKHIRMHSSSHSRPWLLELHYVSPKCWAKCGMTPNTSTNSRPLAVLTSITVSDQHHIIRIQPGTAPPSPTCPRFAPCIHIGTRRPTRQLASEEVVRLLKDLEGTGRPGAREQEDERRSTIYRKISSLHRHLQEPKYK